MTTTSENTCGQYFAEFHGFFAVAEAIPAFSFVSLVMDIFVNFMAYVVDISFLVVETSWSCCLHSSCPLCTSSLIFANTSHPCVVVITTYSLTTVPHRIVEQYKYCRFCKRMDSLSCYHREISSSKA